MAKKTFFFPHDANARNDEKILAIRMKHGMEGYGIYFAIIEKLLESTDYTLLKDYNMVAFELRASAEKVKSVIEDFGLFEFTECGKLFYSKSLIDRMKSLEEKREARSKAGKKGAESRWGNKDKMANAITNDSNAITMPSVKIAEKSKVKESKVKKKKDIVKTISKKNFVPPTLEEVRQYCLERGNGINPEQFIDHYQANGWMRGKNKIKDWRACVRTWEKNRSSGSTGASKPNFV